MNKYRFETDEFGLSDEGVHLLRSRFNYETIAYEQISKVRFERSKVVNNWVLILILGIASLVFSIYYTLILFDVFNDDRISRVYVEEVAIPFLPGFLGSFMIYSALRTGTMMVVSYGRKTKRLPLEKLRKDGQLNEFINEIEAVVNKRDQEVELATLV